MLIVILSSSKNKEFVKEILYELFYPKGAYITADGREYCRNCANNRLQFAAKTMMFVKKCRNMRCITWQDSTGYYLHTVSKSKWYKTFTHWSGYLFTGADKKVCPDTPHAVTCYCPEVQGSQFVIHPLPFILHVAEVQTCRCDALSRVLWHFAILCEYFCT